MFGADVYARDLDLNLLRVFAVVAEEGSITRAAARLYVTQPAVSAAIRRLTAYVGAELITRQGRGVVVTHRGAELLAASRAHLQPLLAVAMAVPVFDPRSSMATVRIGLADSLESLLLPDLVKALRTEAPEMQLIIAPVQFRTVEELLLSNKVDFAVSIADELPRSIVRQPLASHPPSWPPFTCLYDPRHSKLPKKLSEREYFAREHVVVSYAGDARGIVEDSGARARKVRIAVPAFSYVADVVDDSPLLATIPTLVAKHILRTRPHLRSAALPFLSFESTGFELLWSRANDDDDAARFVRGLVTKVTLAIVASLERPGKK
ncbi:LysR family transcriptional regulator [Pendulispora rubella]|uniref:LysR family transcriptional regulator n=1 Tax=Pendulispora rubella TaxID=2741070 RepID=A0ABZ2KWA5_9BACT